MFRIDRGVKRTRGGLYYNPTQGGPNLVDKANFVLMNGKIVDRSQFKGLNFKDDVRDSTYINIAETGLVNDALSQRGVSSDAPVDTAAAAQSVINMRELLGFISALAQADPKMANLLDEYKKTYNLIYTVVPGSMTSVDGNPSVTAKGMGAISSQLSTLIKTIDSRGRSLINLAKRNGISNLTGIQNVMMKLDTLTQATNDGGEVKPKLEALLNQLNLLFSEPVEDVDGTLRYQEGSAYAIQDELNDRLAEKLNTLLRAYDSESDGFETPSSSRSLTPRTPSSEDKRRDRAMANLELLNDSIETPVLRGATGNNQRTMATPMRDLTNFEAVKGNRDFSI
tara:strand:+ start:6221 stop:7237 length:1017 start_codon:yes stop_codon:yes gene_type:complete